MGHLKFCKMQLACSSGKRIRHCQLAAMLLGVVSLLAGLLWKTLQVTSRLNDCPFFPFALELVSFVSVCADVGKESIMNLGEDSFHSEWKSIEHCYNRSILIEDFMHFRFLRSFSVFSNSSRS